MSGLPAHGFAGGKPHATIWRLEKDAHLATWAEGIGARTTGGRWNPKGVAAIYASADTSTTILEVAVHASFDHLEAFPHTMIEIEILDPGRIHVVHPADVPNPCWLTPAPPSAAQQAYGADLLNKHPFIALPSAVNGFAWNVLINPLTANGLYREVGRKRLALDTRLNPPR